MSVETSRYANVWSQLNIYLDTMSNFRLLEVEGRGSETRRQMGESLNYSI